MSNAPIYCCDWCGKSTTVDKAAFTFLRPSDNKASLKSLTIDKVICCTPCFDSKLAVLMDETSRKIFRVEGQHKTINELYWALDLARQMMVGNDLYLRHTFEVIDEALKNARDEGLVTLKDKGDHHE